MGPLPTSAGENNVNGFGLEFYIETPADEIGTSLSDIKKSWQFQLLFTVSQLAAGEGAGAAASGSTAVVLCGCDVGLHAWLACTPSAALRVPLLARVPTGKPNCTCRLAAWTSHQGMAASPTSLTTCSC